MVLRRGSDLKAGGRSEVERMKEFLECTDQPAMICRWSIKRGEGEERIYLWLSMIKMLEKKQAHIPQS